jgi:hypothetical protein
MNKRIFFLLAEQQNRFQHRLNLFSNRFFSVAIEISTVISRISGFYGQLYSFYCDGWVDENKGMVTESCLETCNTKNTKRKQGNLVKRARKNVRQIVSEFFSSQTFAGGSDCLMGKEIRRKC